MTIEQKNEWIEEIKFTMMGIGIFFFGMIAGTRI